VADVCVARNWLLSYFLFATGCWALRECGRGGAAARMRFGAVPRRCPRARPIVSFRGPALVSSCSRTNAKDEALAVAGQACERFPLFAAGLF